LLVVEVDSVGAQLSFGGCQMDCVGVPVLM
jgi:hypothetical protein